MSGDADGVTPIDEADIHLLDNPDESRYEVRVGDALAGFAVYEIEGVPTPRFVFVHTEIDPAFEGHGLGGRLARFALDDAVTKGMPLVPRCSFIATYIRRHPEYLSALEPHYRTRLSS